MPTATHDTWGGRITVRPVPDTTTDIATVQSKGFTVLGQDERAGETTLWVTGNAQSVGLWINDFELKFMLPGFFFPIPFGEEVNLTRVKQWNAFRQIAY